MQLACSWRLHAGCDAMISAAFHGTHGGAALRNVNGSFYDFVAERYRGTGRETLASPPDEWGGRAAGLGCASRGRRAVRPGGGETGRRRPGAGPNLWALTSQNRSLANARSLA